MALNSDCSISGTPTEVGEFSLVVRAGASGVANTTIWNAGFRVLGPTVQHFFPSTISVGQPVDNEVERGVFFWVAGPSDAVTYSVTGALPTGLSINAQTGRIQGTPTATGLFNLQVVVQVSNGGHTVVISGNRITLEIVP